MSNECKVCLGRDGDHSELCSAGRPLPRADKLSPEVEAELRSAGQALALKFYTNQETVLVVESILRGFARKLIISARQEWRSRMGLKCSDTELESAREEIERLKKPCTCGSGGHPRHCERHPEAYAQHIRELDYEGVAAELQAAKAALVQQRVDDGERQLADEQTIRNLEASLEEARAGMGELDSLVVRLQADLASCRKAFEVQQQDALGTIQDLRVQLAGEQNARMIEMESSRLEVERLTRELEEALTRCARWSQQYDAQVEELDKQDDEIEDLRAEVERLKGDLLGAKKESDRWFNAYTELEKSKKEVKE